MPPGSSDKVCGSSSEVYLRADSVSSEMGKGGYVDIKSVERADREAAGDNKKLYLSNESESSSPSSSSSQRTHHLLGNNTDTALVQEKEQHADLLTTTDDGGRLTELAATTPHSHSNSPVEEEEATEDEEDAEEESAELLAAAAVQCVIEPVSDIGAEVVLSENEDDNDLDEVQLPCNDTNHLDVRVELSRRWSYEEVVHEDDEEEQQEDTDELLHQLEAEAASTEEAKMDPLLPLRIALRRNLTTLTQWALTLQEVLDDREGSPLKPESMRCLCHRAESIVSDLRDLERLYMDTIDLFDRASIEPDGMLPASTQCSQRLTAAVIQMQERLGSSVSISVSNPTYDVKSKSAFLVGAVCDVRQYVREASDSVGRLVVSLMHANVCKTHRPHDHARLLKGDLDDDDELDSPAQDDEEMMDISLGVQALCSSETDENLRKRKQDIKTRSPPTSPTSSPSKRPRRVVTARRSLPTPTVPPARVLSLLEHKKKVVRSNGLYQFVLWREALKANRAEEVKAVEEEDEELEEEEQENVPHNATI